MYLSGWTQADASTLANKWYTLYMYPNGHQPNPDSAGIAWWITQIMQDGPAKAWGNFSSSKEPMSYNVVGLAQQYASQYGGPTDLPPSDAGAQVAPSSVPAAFPLTSGTFYTPPSTVQATTPITYTAPTTPAVHTTPTVYAAPAPYNTTTTVPSTVAGTSTATLLLLGGIAVVGFMLLKGWQSAQ